LQAIRRTRLFEPVKGGCASIEITNEENGWHLHSHWLLDCRFLDIGEVAKQWGDYVGQEFAIVKIKDVRGSDYVHEVSKYVVEGNAMAEWPAQQILEFVTAIKGTRFFFQFGSLLAQAPAIRRELAAEKPEAEPCECGGTEWTFETEAMSILREIRQQKRR
jgi:hypothetical protein